MTGEKQGGLIHWERTCHCKSTVRSRVLVMYNMFATCIITPKKTKPHCQGSSGYDTGWLVVNL